MTQKNAQIAMQPNTIGWGLAAKLRENHYGALASNHYYYWGLAAKQKPPICTTASLSIC